MTEVRGNVIVGQSGGPTAVINSSLAGVFKTAKDRGARKVYGMLHGIQGLLQERYVDLEEHIKSDLDIELLKRTPSAYLGSCRFKLPEICDDREIYDKIFSILDKLEVEYFFYIGGNDSMDTIKKLSDYSLLNGSKIRFMGVPKMTWQPRTILPDTAARPSISALSQKRLSGTALYMTSRT